ncbi:hypothetical protein EDB86DRAFT_1895608 [Lactarius hatsudake]|nr:hypothetical protein EDB86DRAFT_1895608 [Lactarius hatsudake]
METELGTLKVLDWVDYGDGRVTLRVTALRRNGRTASARLNGICQLALSLCHFCAAAVRAPNCIVSSASISKWAIWFPLFHWFLPFLTVFSVSGNLKPRDRETCSPNSNICIGSPER